MEGQGGGRKLTGSSSSISNDLFGPKGGYSNKPNSSSPTGIFDSVFSHPSSYSRSDMTGTWRKTESENQSWNSKQQTPGNSSQTTSESQGQGGYSKARSSVFQDGRVEPHYLSSSLYYGGQDVCSNPSDTTRSSGSPHTQYKKDKEDGDQNGSNLHSASRGNWWQGGLYY